MQKLDEKHIFQWALLCLLAFSPLIRGGHQVWAALLVTGGVGLLWTLCLARSLWTGSLRVAWCPEDLLLFVGFCWALIGLFYPLTPSDSFISLLILLGCTGGFFLARKISSLGLALDLAKGLSAIGASLALIGVAQILGLLPHGWWSPPQFMASTFINHNHLAAYLEIIFPISFLIWLAAPLRPRDRFLSLISTGLIGMGLLLSCSRGAWLSLVMTIALVVGIFGFQRGRKVASAPVIIVIFFSFLIVGFLFTRPLIFSRAATLLDVPNEASFQARQAIWNGTWNLIKENPLLGHGLGSFLVAFPRHRPAGLFRLINYAHNDYFQLIAELGLVGLALAISIGSLFLRRIIKLINLSQSLWKRALGLGALMGLTSVAIHSLVDFPLHIPAVLFEVAVVAGLVSGIEYKKNPLPLRILQLNFSDSPRPFARWFPFSFLMTVVLIFFGMLISLIAADAWASQGNLNRAVRLAPFRALYHEQLGSRLSEFARAHRGQERMTYLKQAVEEYQKALKLVPHHPWNEDALGEIFKQMGSFREADLWLHRAVSDDPNNPLYWEHWAELKLIQKDASGAAQSFRRAAELSQPYHFYPSIFGNLNDPKYFAQRGHSALLSGQREYAKTAFEVAKIFNPNQADAETGLAIVDLMGGDFKKARQRMTQVRDPKLQAQWFATLAKHQLSQGGRLAPVREALDTSLKLDSSNVLAWHLQIVLKRDHQENPEYVNALDRLLALNQPPVSVTPHPLPPHSVVWEPEKGNYEEGHRSKDGWMLFSNGVLRQKFFIPPVKTRFTLVVSGTKVKEQGPVFTLRWNNRPVLVAEAKSEQWTVYNVEIEIKPGESFLTLDFFNDLNDPLTQENRNLKIEKMVASWEPL